MALWRQCFSTSPLLARSWPQAGRQRFGDPLSLSRIAETSATLRFRRCASASGERLSLCPCAEAGAFKGCQAGLGALPPGRVGRMFRLQRIACAYAPAIRFRLHVRSTLSVGGWLPLVAIPRPPPTECPQPCLISALAPAFLLPVRAAQPTATPPMPAASLSPDASSWLTPLVRARFFRRSAHALPVVVRLGSPSARRGAVAPLDVDAPDPRTTSRPTDPPCDVRRRGYGSLRSQAQSPAPTPSALKGTNHKCLLIF